MFLALFMLLAGGCAKHSSGRLFISEHGSIDGEAVTLWTIDNGHGVKAKVMDYGATLVSLEVEGRRGQVEDLVFGDGPWESRIGGRESSGAITGRHREFDRRVWAGTPFNSTDGFGVRFRLVSPAGDSGHPGRVDAEVDYVLTDQNNLKVIMKATSQEATPIGMTHRGVWAISEDDSIEVNGDELAFDSIPSSNQNASEYILYQDGTRLHLAATLRNASEDSVMSVWTNQPAFRMETCGLEGSIHGVELQTMSMVGSLDVRSDGSSDLLVPGDPYRHVVVYRFHLD